jgi:hypothetical protein
LSKTYYELCTFANAFKGLESSEIESKELSELKMGQIVRMNVWTVKPNIAVGLIDARRSFV